MTLLLGASLWHGMKGPDTNKYISTLPVIAAMVYPVGKIIPIAWIKIGKWEARTNTDSHGLARTGTDKGTKKYERWEGAKLDASVKSSSSNCYWGARLFLAVKIDFWQFRQIKEFKPRICANARE